MTRRSTLTRLDVATAGTLLAVLFVSNIAVAQPKLAGITTVYRKNSHADVIFSRHFLTDTLDGEGRVLPASLASLHALQTPESDLSVKYGREFQIPVYDSVRGALLLGQGKLAVDGVLLVAEHGEFPDSRWGQKLYPKRKLMAEVAQVVQEARDAAGEDWQAPPIFIDKMLADNWEDSQWIYQRCKELGMPLMAGSSVPSAWRRPPVDVKRNAVLQEITAVSYGGLESYGFHALEMVQCLAERRQGGETGVAAVRMLEGDKVWQAAGPLYQQELLELCLAAQQLKRKSQRPLRERVKKPTLIHIRYRDGLRANVLVLNGAVRQWAAAWRTADGATTGARFEVQEDRPYMHFAHLLKGVHAMMNNRKPTWPAERTLLTTAILHAAFRSQQAGGRPIANQALDVRYQSAWNWRQPREP